MPLLIGHAPSVVTGTVLTIGAAQLCLSAGRARVIVRFALPLQVAVVIAVEQAVHTLALEQLNIEKTGPPCRRPFVWLNKRNALHHPHGAERLRVD